MVSKSDWAAARDYVALQVKPDDLIAFVPRWADPIGRERFGFELATFEREARADESRFPRAFEVSIRGAHLAELHGWRRVGDRRFGAVTVTTFENPAPARVLEDLVSMVGAQRMRVSQGDRDCAFVHTSPQSGGLGFGPAVPGDRFACPSGGFVGASVVADLDYLPHRCIYAPPAGVGALRLHFLDVLFGTALDGHHALYVEAERSRQGAPVTITFSVGDAVLGSVVHRDGEGWKPFELDTTELLGKRADLVADIASGGERRMYCFEATTR
ncbi:MAG: hypothetical protein M3O46_14110 [Myxococcota bacterium]|nr:hypothetical protein [Myxococcota bacterium]